MDRAGWAEMIATLHSNGVRTIIVEKLDRLARDLMVQEACIADLQKHGFTLISVAEPDLMASIHYARSHASANGRCSSIRQVSGRRKTSGCADAQTREEGRCEGRKPYGFYPGEGEIVARMKALRAEGLGFDKVAARMNAEGISTRTRGRWHGVMVNRIL